MIEPILKVKNINKSYGALKASKDICLDLQAGEIHALIGPNGAGKTTLIKQIVGALRPDSGRVELMGQNISALSVVERARLGLGRTFQISSLAMEDTVLQNVVLGAIGASGNPFQFFKPAMKNTQAINVARDALQRVGLTDQANQTAASISHGQRRQLEVAIALTLSPKAFIMDEPMAGLGASGSKRLTGFLAELKVQAPILLVEHDMDAVFALADRISVLVYGQIIATGTVDEIRTNPEVRTAYLGDEE